MPKLSHIAKKFTVLPLHPEKSVRAGLPASNAPGSVCLERVIEILRNHTFDGDRYLRLATQQLIARSARALEGMQQ
jgi:hypothetical protein